MGIEEVVIQAQKGDANAFYDLIEGRKVMLYKTAYMYVKNEQDALDIVGETVYKAYLSIKKLKHPEYFNTWLTRILINCAVDFIRKNKIVIPLEHHENIPAKDVFATKEEFIDLYYAIDKLNTKYKTIIILKYFQDLTLQQIADTLQYPIGTVKSYLHKALQELRLDRRLREEF